MLELTHDSDDDAPVACATTFGTALFPKQVKKKGKISKRSYFTTDLLDDAPVASASTFGTANFHKQIP